MSLEKLIESHYAPKKGKEILFDIIHKKLNEQWHLPLPQITAAIGRGEGDEKDFDKKTQNLNDFIRKIMALPFMDNFGRSKSLRHRIKMINDFQNKTPDSNISIKEFIGVVAFLQEFSKIVREWNPIEKKLAGFEFEMLMSVFFNGTEIFNYNITDFTTKYKLGNNPEVIEDFSVKFIRMPTGDSSYEVSGSIYNFIKTLFEKRSLIYLVCLKDESNNLFHFFEIKLDPEKFDFIFNWESTRARELFGFNSKFAIERFERRKQGESADVYKTRLLNRINEVGKIYKSNNVEFETKSSPVLFSDQFSESIFTDSSSAYAGTIDISEEQVNRTRDAYKDDLMGKIGNIFDKTANLNKNLLSFFVDFKKSDPPKRANMILDKMDELKYAVSTVFETDLNVNIAKKHSTNT